MAGRFGDAPAHQPAFAQLVLGRGGLVEQLVAQPIGLRRAAASVEAEAAGVAPRLIASAADVEAIAASDEADVPALKGRRREVFGERALALKHGKLALKLKDGKVAIEDTGA